MIKLTATATIRSISPVIEITPRSGGNPFQKRELILDDSWTDNEGRVHPNFVAIEFTGDAMAQLDNFLVGQRVSVESYVNGREWNGKVLNSIRGRLVVPVATAAYQQTPPTSAYIQTSAANQMPPSVPPTVAAPTSPTSYTSAPSAADFHNDGLPF